MHPNIERCLPHLTKLADSIGWNGVIPNCHDANGLDVVWYTSGENTGDESDLFLQINEHPIGNTTEFAGAVYALRHSLWTGWHSFPLPDSNDRMRLAIERIDCWLNRKWFTDENLRIQFSNEHPECCGFDWDRIRETQPPHNP